MSVQLTVSFRNTDSSPALLGRIEKLANRLTRREPAIKRVRAVCRRDGPLCEVEVHAGLPGQPVVAKAVSDNLYVAADLCFDKLHSRVARARARREPAAAARRAA